MKTIDEVLDDLSFGEIGQEEAKAQILKVILEGMPKEKEQLNLVPESIHVNSSLPTNCGRNGFNRALSEITDYLKKCLS